MGAAVPSIASSATRAVDREPRHRECFLLQCSFQFRIWDLGFWIEDCTQAIQNPKSKIQNRVSSCCTARNHATDNLFSTRARRNRSEAGSGADPDDRQR